MSQKIDNVKYVYALVDKDGMVIESTKFWTMPHHLRGKYNKVPFWDSCKVIKFKIEKEEEIPFGLFADKKKYEKHKKIDEILKEDE